MVYDWPTIIHTSKTPGLGIGRALGSHTARARGRRQTRTIVNVARKGQIQHCSAGSSHAGRSNMTKTGLGLPGIGILLANRKFICLPCHPCCLNSYVIRYLSQNSESHSCSGAHGGFLTILPVLFRQEGHQGARGMSQNVREEHFSRPQRPVGPDG